MNKHDINASNFDTDTLAKLEIYREYLSVFLHVFIEKPDSIKAIQIFDFFAGSGQDSSGKPGSPLIAKSEIESVLLKETKKQPLIKLFLNEIEVDKASQLSRCIEDYSSPLHNFIISVSCKSFEESFDELWPQMNGNANLVFLDQYGVKEVGKSVFQKLTSLHRTDILFFISSSTANRFKKDPNIRKYLPLSTEDFNQMNGTNCHRIISKAYARWVPDGIEYYLSSFSFRKGANVYGLVFGSHHPLGIEKFLRIAWRRGGDANFDIDFDQQYRKNPVLFEELAKPKKITAFEIELTQAILSGKLSTDHNVFLFCISNGFLGSHGKRVLCNLKNNGIIKSEKFSVSYDGWKNKKAKAIVITGGIPT